MAKQNFSPALDAAQNQLGLTFSASDSLDTKALGVLGFVVALFIFAVQSEIKNPWWLLAPLFVMLGCAALCAILVIWPRDYKGAIVDLNEHTEYLAMEENELALQLLVDTQSAITDNTTLNNQKSQYCGLGIVAILVSVGFLVGCIL
jgi:hypothetical protein